MKAGKFLIVRALREHTWRAERSGIPIDPEDLTINPNSVDVTLGDVLLRPRLSGAASILDPLNPESVSALQWDRIDCTNGFILQQGQFVLGCTRERFDCTCPVIVESKDVFFAPMYEGRSTCGRIGILSHVTAGFGDYGFNAPFTLELATVFPYPVKLTAGMRIGQVAFEQVCEPSTYRGAYKASSYAEPTPPALGPSRF